jgi:catechol 2,3-dioxygenase-like lactoylglutathione lyase family enzyme
MPTIRRVVETALYVDDMEGALRFYEQVMHLTPLGRGQRWVALDAGEGTVLLLFLRGAAADGVSFPGGWIPPHDGAGPSHIAFAIHGTELEAWRRRLEDAGISVESEVSWPRGGTSLYFRDPDGHSVELATPGLWSVY